MRPCGFLRRICGMQTKAVPNGYSILDDTTEIKLRILSYNPKPRIWREHSTAGVNHAAAMILFADDGGLMLFDYRISGDPNKGDEPHEPGAVGFPGAGRPNRTGDAGSSKTQTTGTRKGTRSFTAGRLLFPPCCAKVMNEFSRRDEDRCRLRFPTNYRPTKR